MKIYLVESIDALEPVAFTSVEKAEAYIATMLNPNYYGVVEVVADSF